MKFELDEAMAALSRAPKALTAMLSGLPRNWVENNEGPETWSPYDVIGHLVHCERNDWIQRAKIILEHGEARPFDPVNRLAQFEESKGKTLEELLEEFAALRERNLATLREMKLGAGDLERTGRHPALGKVALKELLATWVTHDLDHVAQIARTMAKQYAAEVGPWEAYLSILRDRKK
ncbi:MAG TPA: DinB family protein [Blastocatellia bacterium]